MASLGLGLPETGETRVASASSSSYSSLETIACCPRPSAPDVVIPFLVQKNSLTPIGQVIAIAQLEMGKQEDIDRRTEQKVAPTDQIPEVQQQICA